MGLLFRSASAHSGDLLFRSLQKPFSLVIQRGEKWSQQELFSEENGEHSFNLIRGCS